VHGVTGDMLGTWTASNGKTFFNLVDQNDAMHGKADAFVFGFPSYFFKSGSFDIREAANRLDLHLHSSGVLDYPAVVFVAHSMGGLVVMRELLTHREVMKKVPVVVFYATPMEGSALAAIGQELSSNSALAQMTDTNANALLQTLDEEWNSADGERRPPVRCAYEKIPMGPLKVVEWSSATRLCEGTPAPIAADHVTIVKPDNAGADAILVLQNALDRYVLNQTLDAKLDTPDFKDEGGNEVFTLQNALGKATARLANVGGSPLTFTIAEISDPTALLLWPDDTPQEIAPHDHVLLGIALSRGATASEYHFILRTGIAPDKQVIVRIPDLGAVKAQQVEMARTVASDIQTILNDPQRNQRFLAAGTDDADAREALVQIAKQAVAREAPGLPDGAHWVLTADLLNAANWPTLASRALKNAETVSKATARSPGAQHLAGIVAAQSGEGKIFDIAPTRVASSEAVAAWKVVQPLAEPANADVATALAARMQQMPALKVYGYSLEGDLHAARGDAPAAVVAYSEAEKLRKTPSVSGRLLRLRSVSTVASPSRNTAAAAAVPPAAKATSVDKARRLATQPQH
jgi:hypothetical protein